MKKAAVIIITVISICIFAGCTPEAIGTETHVETGLRIADTMEDMETLLSWTSYVVKARMISSEDIKGASDIKEYQFEVIENYCGETETIIHLEAEAGQYKKGKKYYLFLDKYDSVFWGNPLYSNAAYDTVFKAKKTVKFPFTSGTVKYKWNEIESIIAQAEADGTMGTETGNYDYITSCDTLEEAVKAADLVVKIEILSKRSHTDASASYFIKPVEFIKGEETDIGDSYSLQYGPEAGEEYFLLLKDIGQSSEGRYVTFDRNYISVKATPENRSIIEKALQPDLK